MGWRSVNRTPAAGTAVVTIPEEPTATVGRAAHGAHGCPSWSLSQSSPGSVLGTDPSRRAVTLLHLQPLGGVPCPEKHKAHTALHHLPTPSILRKHEAQCSWEAQITLTFAQSPGISGAECGWAAVLCLAQGSVAL